MEDGPSEETRQSTCRRSPTSNSASGKHSIRVAPLSAALQAPCSYAHQVNRDTTGEPLPPKGGRGGDRNSPARLCVGQAGCRLHRRSAEEEPVSLTHSQPSSWLREVYFPNDGCCAAARTTPKFSPSNVTSKSIVEALGCGTMDGKTRRWPHRESGQFNLHYRLTSCRERPSVFAVVCENTSANK